MNIDKIVEVNIQISEAMSIDGGYDKKRVGSCGLS